MTTKNLRWIMLVLTVLLLTACVRSTATPPPEATVNSTPNTPPTVTAEPDLSATETATPLPTPQADCTDGALYVDDVSIPDNTRMQPGQAFTKTWRLKNTGTCIWNVRYGLIFVGGEQMGAAITTPLSETPPGQTLDISVELKAPARDGAFTGLFELRNPKGSTISVGVVTSIWVKVVVGNGTISAPTVATTAPASAATVVPGTVCKPQQSLDYIAQILGLLNSARADAKLTPLNINGALSAAAQAHSDDMACNNFIGHNGSDGSSIHARVAAAGYAPSYSEEIIYASGTPQDAFNWWINDKTHRDAILNPNAVDVGIGYTYVPGTAYGTYYTVDFAAP